MSNNYRPGKFLDLRTFLDLAPEDNYKPEYMHGIVQNPQPGHIIHIIDSDNGDQSRRLHDRVMLVVRPDQGGHIICRPLCLHGEGHVCKAHWPVTTSSPDSASDGIETTLSSLSIELFHGALQPRITVNLNEPWNVELDGTIIAILGKVRASTWNTVVDRIIQLVVRSLGDVKLKVAEPQLVPSVSPPVGEHANASRAEKSRANRTPRSKEEPPQRQLNKGLHRRRKSVEGHRAKRLSDPHVIRPHHAPSPPKCCIL